MMLLSRDTRQDGSPLRLSFDYELISSPRGWPYQAARGFHSGFERFSLIIRASAISGFQLRYYRCPLRHFSLRAEMSCRAHLCISAALRFTPMYAGYYDELIFSFDGLLYYQR